ncbi:rhomboid family intramembrane serine protease [Bacillus alkalisoli]|uniref:rhomboid family intramembrane serine protease n=1 Tax=Bacillus alkalisoli TaxID=2011008 RepID=UPI000C239DDB|nr:rhomboid family intramembrane serine protease [Bacillus alkalisoli]
MFVRTENFNTFTRLYPIVTGIIVIHLVFWVLATVSNPFYYYTLGINGYISGGEYWRLLTPIFAHVSLMHLLFNSFSLVLFGPELERMLGKVKFVAVYLCAGIIANVATLFLEPPTYVHLGASGAIFGLFGLYLYMVFFRPDLLSSSNAQIIVIILVIGLVMTFVNSNINYTAHIFGFLGGLALAPIFIGKGSFQGTRSLRHIFPRGTFGHGRRSGGLNFVWILLILLIAFGLMSRL